MDSIAPTSTVLYNYDQDRNTTTGLTLDRTALGLSETSTSKVQVWRTAPQVADLTITGDVRVDIWGALKGFTTSTKGVVTVYLRDYETSTATYVEIGNGSTFAEDWSGGTGDFVKRTVIIADVNHTVIAGNEIEVRLVVEDFSDDSMWFAYDVTSRQSVIKMSTAISSPLPRDNFESGDLAGGTAWLDDWTVTIAPVSVTSTNAPFLGTYHLLVEKGADTKRSADLSGQTNLRWQFQAKVTGLTGQRKARAWVSSDGSSFTEVGTWGDQDYQFVDIDLSPYTMTAQFWFRFSLDSGGGGNPADMYVDELKVTE